MPPATLPSRLCLSTFLPAIAVAQLFLRPGVNGLTLSFPAACSSGARSATAGGPVMASSSSSAAAAAQDKVAMPFPTGSKPVKEIESPRPKLWIYDHCPYCVRPRMVFGLKGITHDLAYLSNDDIETPTAMVGKKMVPILELGRPGSDDHEIMAESMDIVKRLDLDPQFGPPVLAPAVDRKDLDSWVSSAGMLMRRLVRPRNAVTPLAEFQTRSAREAFVRNHPLPEPSSYEANLKASPKLIEELERELWKLEGMIHSPTSVAADGKLSYNDIEFFPRMRGLTIVQGLGIPPKLRAYLDAVSERVDVPLYDKIAS
ncbi:unnamed protein product [Ectocarpus sp. CCAP 1310/34]|nr:unnamed protein product [Ectocarpus sp. CCAP 1310/34]